MLNASMWYIVNQCCPPFR